VVLLKETYGVAGQFAELLESDDVDTVKELRNRNAQNLATKIAEVNTVKKLCKVSPSEYVINKGIEETKTLHPILSY
jgi:hypothetical protein